MKIFRQKYLYNSQNPIFSNQKVKTYNCLNTESKDNRLLLLQHLTPYPQVEGDKHTLQPLEYPTTLQPYSVYPLVHCCSQVGKLNQNDAMYILQCLVSSRTKKPIYYILSPQGIVCSEVEGLLPSVSPDLFHLALQLLDLEPNLIELERSIVSRQGYSICKAIRDGIINLSYFDTYGWKDAKKENNISDEKFWVFMGRKKENSPFNNDEYALAWNSSTGLCRVKHIDLNKEAYEPQLQDDFNHRIKFYEQHSDSKTISTLKIHKVVKDKKGLNIFTSIANQGNLHDYVTKKTELNQRVTEYSMQSLLQAFVQMMSKLASGNEIRGHMCLHIGNLWVNDNKILLGEPQFITDKKEKKIRDMKKGYDYFSPQFKENIIMPEKLFSLDQEKMDAWSFGFLLHYMFTLEVPNFDAKKNAIVKKGLSGGMEGLIRKCLSQDPSRRPKWSEINLRSLEKDVQISDLNHDDEELQSRSVKKKQQIRLDSPSREHKLKKQAHSSMDLKRNSSDRTTNGYHQLNVREQEAMLPKEEEQEEKINKPQFEYMLPPEISSKLKRIKLVIKLILIMVMYLVVFFGPFIQNSFEILLLKGNLQKTPLNLVDNTGNIVSSVTILSAQSKFFLYNDISFSEIQNKYHCINDKFDPINNPNYSLYNYVKSSNFQTLIYTGWAAAMVICVIKGLSIWRGGISNRPRKPNRKYWAVYAFQELSLASLLFAHFFIYQFFYFAGISPCFYIESYGGVEPMFDSSLYLFLGNSGGYMLKVFSTLGVLSFILTISGCFYAWGPKFDMKYFLSVPSILFRFVPYILLFLLCRIGVFSLFSPTALSDSTSIITSIIGSSSQGFFGIIPQVFVMICITIEIILELLLYYCEQKASQSDSLSKLFNINDIKSLKRSGSYNSGGIDRSLNQMSLDNSKHHLEEFN